MKEYDVLITETLQRTVTVQANSEFEATDKVSEDWKSGKYVLGADDFAGADFGAVDEREISPAAMMNVLLVQPGMTPERISIKKELSDLQENVGGNIEAMYPYDDPVALVVNDEGKMIGLPLNRALRDEDGKIADIIAGAFLVVGLGKEDFDTLSPKLMEKYEKLFHQPEAFIRIGGDIEAIPLPDRTNRSVGHTKHCEPER